MLQDAASCTAEVAYTLDSVTGSLDTSKGFRVEARMTVTSLREKQFHALAAVDLSDGMVSPRRATAWSPLCTRRVFAPATPSRARARRAQSLSARAHETRHPRCAAPPAPLHGT